MAHPCGQRSENQRMIAKRHMISNEQNWSIEVVQIFHSKNTHSAHHERNRQNNRVEKQNTYPRGWKSIRPGRVRIRPRAFINFAAHYALDISNSCCVGKSCFVNIDLILIFKCAKQLDSSKRIQLQIRRQLK